jgi:hypothetical protein
MVGPQPGVARMKLASLTSIAIGSLLVVGVALVAGVPAAAARGRVAAAGSAIGEPSPESRSLPRTEPRQAAGATATTLTVTPATGPAYQSVTMTATVSSASGVPQGSVTFLDGSSPVARVALGHGVASVTVNSFGPGPHDISAQFTGVAGDEPSTSLAVPVAFGSLGAPGSPSVVVTIPAGYLTITTPHGGTRRSDLGHASLDMATSTSAGRTSLPDIVITDTRAGNLGFTATVVASRFVNERGGSFAGSRAGLTGLAAHQVQGNALRAADVRVLETPPGSPGLGSPRVFARYPAGLSTGTVHVTGVLEVSQLPSSVSAGRFAARLTFTAL